MSPQSEAHLYNGDYPVRVPLRLRMSPLCVRNRFDGVWWPQTLDPFLEVADLVDGFPIDWPRTGRIARVLLSGDDWDASGVRFRVRTARGGFVKVSSPRKVQTHVALASMMDRSVLQLVVVPPRYSAAEGDRVMSEVVAPGCGRTASDLLHHAA